MYGTTSRDVEFSVFINFACALSLLQKVTRYSLQYMSSRYVQMQQSDAAQYTT